MMHCKWIHEGYAAETATQDDPDAVQEVEAECECASEAEEHHDSCICV